MLSDTSMITCNCTSLCVSCQEAGHSIYNRDAHLLTGDRARCSCLSANGLGIQDVYIGHCRLALSHYAVCLQVATGKALTKHLTSTKRQFFQMIQCQSDDRKWFHGNEKWSVHDTWMWVSAQTARKPSEPRCDLSGVGQFADYM
jgi:hypothetical protein